MVRKPLSKRIIMWALTYQCNASCNYCYLRDYKQSYKDINEEQYFSIAKKIIDCKDWQPQAIWLTGGEPTILPFLPELISSFESNGISVILNTNSMIGKEKLSRILNVSPSGIIVSLDSNPKLMIDGRKVLFSEIVERVENIAKNKIDKTILGVATVLTRETIDDLYEFAIAMEKIGVEYISINPMHNWKEENRVELGPALRKQIDLIKSKLSIRVPSDLYIDMVERFYLNDLPDIACTALHNYFFIAPWGYLYPCSNEKWQKYNGFEIDLLTSENWYLEAKVRRPEHWNKGLSSPCFSDRCLGCFKLYYDSIFTGDLCYYDA